jgi:nitrogen regulatory protein P-II 1
LRITIWLQEHYILVSDILTLGEYCGIISMFIKILKGEVLIKMKKLEIVIRPEKLEDLKLILNENNAQGLMITNIMGYGKQKGYVQIYRGTKTMVNLLPKIKVETVVSAEIAETIIEKILERIKTGNYGDGKIFIYEVEDVVRIRTGERGQDAL